MERASFWRCARLLICISDADAAPQCSQLALRSPDVPAHWAIMTAAARRLVTTSAASNASVARVPAEGCAAVKASADPANKLQTRPTKGAADGTLAFLVNSRRTALGGRRARSSCDRIGRCRRPLVAVRSEDWDYPPEPCSCLAPHTHISRRAHSGRRQGRHRRRRPRGGGERAFGRNGSTAPASSALSVFCLDLTSSTISGGTCTPLRYRRRGPTCDLTFVTRRRTNTLDTWT